MAETDSAPAKGTETGNLWAVLTEPERGFTSLAARPTFALALILLVLVGVAAVWVGFSKLDAQDVLRTLEEQGRELPPAAAANPERLMSFMRWSSVAGAALFAPLLYLGLSGIFLVSFRLLGSEMTYRQSLATTVHGMLPMGVAGVLGILVGLFREGVTMRELESGGLVMSHLGFLAGEDASAVVRAALTSVDLFSIWCIFLLALGFRIVAKVGRSKAMATATTVWLVGVAVKLLLALLR